MLQLFLRNLGGYLVISGIIKFISLFFFFIIRIKLKLNIMLEILLTIVITSLIILSMHSIIIDIKKTTKIVIKVLCTMSEIFVFFMCITGLLIALNSLVYWLIPTETKETKVEITNVDINDTNIIYFDKNSKELKKIKKELLPNCNIICNETIESSYVIYHVKQKIHLNYEKLFLTCPGFIYKNFNHPVVDTTKEIKIVLNKKSSKNTYNDTS